TYLFAVTPSRHLEHLYYGGKIPVDKAEDCAPFRERHEFELGNCISYDKKFPGVMLEDMCLEMSGAGHGDIREPFVSLVYPDGSRSVDFLYEKSTLSNQKEPLQTLPCAYTENGKTEHLIVELRDGALVMELHYTVYPACDVITRSAVLLNEGDKVQVERLMSMQLDMPFGGAAVTSFHGAWGREMNRHTAALPVGKLVLESRTGCSSNRVNPFFMVHSPDANEASGSVYGFNLIYSGNHYAAAEVNAYGKTRIVSGIQPEGFRWLLEKDGRFETPEAVMTYSENGFTGQSQNMHRFVRDHIVRGVWRDRPRPVLLNSWEACYFNINEKSLVSMARSAKDLGVELLVMDDGWFGERDNDRCSLGDWTPSVKKLPGGLRSLAEKIIAEGLKFGIWVEPEMVNTDSRLYRKHPDWAMAIPGKRHSEGRTQRVLDLANPEVQDFLIQKMSEVFSSAPVSYVKWDMNRIFSDVFSPYLPAERQGETAHRYIMGLYRVMKALTEQFPDILFEGCASGGNRFDLGILCYFPQIWGSDNTDAISRAHIQEGYSYGYPLSCVGAHVSASPNHQTLRETPLETRFAVAAFGMLGYEYDVRDLSAEQKQKIKEQIALYKRWRKVLQNGQFYRLQEGNLHQWMCVSPTKKYAVALLLQELITPNTQTQRLVARGLDAQTKYKFYNRPEHVNVKLFGSLINTVAPIHIKQDSLLHNVIAKRVKMDGETDVYTASGEQLMRSGVALSPMFGGTGFNDKVRVFPDFAARLYFMEALEEEN
ncbi:MAG: alpha-galactosidase, partial [Ruminococcus sp.]|nr:alpha-galactosidase [Ruminococcus sp.]